MCVLRCKKRISTIFTWRTHRYTTFLSEACICIDFINNLFFLLFRRETYHWFRQWVFSVKRRSISFHLDTNVQTKFFFANHLIFVVQLEKINCNFLTCVKLWIWIVGSHTCFVWMRETPSIYCEFIWCTDTCWKTLLNILTIHCLTCNRRDNFFHFATNVRANVFSTQLRIFIV